SLKAANLLVGRLLRVDPRSVDSYDRKDGVGELVNMIAGSTKIELARLTDASYNLSLPSLIVGNNHEIISRPKDSPYLVMVFELEGQEFIVQMAYKPK
ncbi:MAG: chemotaxis protein CheX, partial [Cyanobacteria bacterium HKST-UBA05]|nr:chemotaxis protein CheX [Cyanobacteria bacterium HKST-UBA05]